jgi:hypothetical protein
MTWQGCVLPGLDEGTMLGSHLRSRMHATTHQLRLETIANANVAILTVHSYEHIKTCCQAAIYIDQTVGPLTSGGEWLCKIWDRKLVTVQRRHDLGARCLKTRSHLKHHQVISLYDSQASALSNEWHRSPFQAEASVSNFFSAPRRQGREPRLDPNLQSRR